MHGNPGPIIQQLLRLSNTLHHKPAPGKRELTRQSNRACTLTPQLQPHHTTHTIMHPKPTHYFRRPAHKHQGNPYNLTDQNHTPAQVFDSQVIAPTLILSPRNKLSPMQPSDSYSPTPAPRLKPNKAELRQVYRKHIDRWPQDACKLACIPETTSAACDFQISTVNEAQQSKVLLRQSYRSDASRCLLAYRKR